MASAALLDQLSALLRTEALARVEGFSGDMADTYAQVVPRDQGTLASAFRTEVTPLASVVRLHAEVDDTVAPHGKWIDQPVDEIIPVRAKVLHWFGKGGEDVFARRVVPSRVHEGWWQRFVDEAVQRIS